MSWCGGLVCASWLGLFGSDRDKADLRVVFTGIDGCIIGLCLVGT